MFAANYTGGQLVYPLLYDYPEDEEALKNIEETYMLGDAIKVSPILSPSFYTTGHFESYFPPGVWYDLRDFSNRIEVNGTGKYRNLSHWDGHTEIHLKDGKIIPW